LTIEETTSSQWLYVELKEYVDEIIICDTYRNKLFSEGAKNDKIDAVKLAMLLRGEFLKPVFHSCDKIIELRKLVSTYDDLIQRGVRLKNQKSAILRSVGKLKTETIEIGIEKFLIEQIDRAICSYESDRKIYENEFTKQIKSFLQLRHLLGIPGIGIIGAVKIAAFVVDAKRFKHRNNFLSYCGLVKLQRESGGKNYGSKRPRYNRQLKTVFKTAALATIRGNGPFRKLYDHLVFEKRYPEYKARHAVAQKIAVATFGTMYSGKKFNPLEIGALKAVLTKA
jgi:transposase